MGSVLKFGGTSVGSIAKIKAVAARIAQRRNLGEDLVIVVSAMGKMTDELIAKAKAISGKPSYREMDMLMATGEQQSIALLTIALQSLGIEAVSLTGFQAGIKTTGQYTKNKIEDIDTAGLEGVLSKQMVAVVAGFQGMNAAGDITTLGRGGSDTTAVAIAAKLGFSCEIYTDVAGVYSVDPRIIPCARQLAEIDYTEMMEMASLGAGVMEPRAVEIAKKYNVPIYVAMSHSDTVGTWIREVKAMEEKVITGLSVNDNILMISLQNVVNTPEMVANIFQALDDRDVNIDMISQTAPLNGLVNISFTCSNEEVCEVEDALSQIKEQNPSLNLTKKQNITKISVVGIGMRDATGVASAMFAIFAREGIRFYQVTTSEISISYTIDQENKQRAVEAIAEQFQLTEQVQ